MKVINHSKSLKEELSLHRDKKVGFVPTMGALHMGHMSLVEAAMKKSDFVISSIFVNPTQFDNKNDLNNYPSSLMQDLELLKSKKVDIVFCPSFKDLYSSETSFELSLGGLDRVLEGKTRIGHFDGVLRVLNLFFSLINPDFAFFGEKDYQQFLIVSQLVEMFFPKISIVACPTLREKNGLAMSSRNSRLSENDRIIASKIHYTLNYCRTHFKIFNSKELQIKCLEMLKEFSDPEYFEIRTSKTLSNQMNSYERYRAFVATKLSGVRLIDNLALN